MTYRTGGYGGPFFNSDDIRPATASHQGLLSKADFAKLATLAVPVFRLNYIAAADLAVGAAIAANTWTTVGAAQSFTLSSTATFALVAASGNVIGVNTASTELGSALLFDGATRVMLGGNYNPTATANMYANFLAGAGPVILGGFAAGAHTVAVQVISSLAGVYFCRPATQPNLESLRIIVLELNP